MDRRPSPPSGEPPPEVAVVDGRSIPLDPLARRTCQEFDRRFPDYRARYGDAAEPWCLHDTKYLMAWSAIDVSAAAAGSLFVEQVGWLARVLHARAFPLEQLAAHLDIVAGILSEAVPERGGTWHDLAEAGKVAIATAVDG